VRKEKTIVTDRRDARFESYEVSRRVIDGTTTWPAERRV